MNARFPTPYEAVGARLRPVALPPGGLEGSAPLFDLRVLNGAQKDAVVSFGAGRLLIGNDLECDIVLHRPGETLRAMLSVIDGRLSVAGISGPLQLNQVAVAPGESQTAVHGDTIRLADIGLLLSRHEPQAPQEREAEAAEVEEVLPEPEPEAAPEAEAGKEAAHAEAPAPRPMVWPAVVCLVLAGACIAGWLFQGPDDSANHDQRLVPQSVRAGAAVPAPPRSRLLADAREILGARRIQAEVELQAPDVLVLGVGPARLAQARDALTALLTDVDGVKRVDVRLDGDKGNVPAMSATHGPDGVVITDNLMLDADAVFNGKNRIVMVSVAPMPSILTQGGRRLFQGAQLDARTTVEAISPTLVTVTIDGARRRVKP